MKNKIKLSINHTNAKRIEYFLNQLDEELVEVPFEWRTWKNSEQINDGCKFVSTDLTNPLTISILFCDSYQDANEIGKANALPYLPTAKWSVNGNVMFLVENIDVYKVNDVLSLFAGEE